MRIRSMIVALAACVLVAPVSARELTFLDVVAIAGWAAALAACWAAGERMLALAPKVAAARSRRRP